MKFNYKIIFAFALTISCINLSHSQNWGKNNKVDGSGNITTKTVTTQAYDVINVVGSMDVALENGSEGNITVTADDNFHEHITIESNGTVLTIEIEKNFSLQSKKGIHITVPFKDLTQITLMGSGDIKTKNTIKATEFSISVTGSGDAILDIEATTIDAKLTGSGDIELKGKVQDLEVKISGSGDFEGTSLTATNTEAYVSGSGDAKVFAKNSIKARVNGSGGIQYIGNPAKSDTKVMGSGSIKAM
jgi:hypothetical protein